MATDIVGWDSMKYVELILAVEERYQIRLQTRDVDRLKSVGDIVSIAVERMARCRRGEP
jgi:acyl carrier protein